MYPPYFMEEANGCSLKRTTIFKFRVRRGAFTAFAKFTGNPNIHSVADVITPHWDLYTDGNFGRLRTGY